MRKSNKKGFTVVELVIVIAIIAILAGVLIPTFAGLIQKANESNDIQAAKNMNTFLAAANVNGDVNSILDVYDLFEDSGYSVESYKPLYAGRSYYYDKQANQIVYVDDATGKILFPTDRKDQLQGDHDWMSLSLTLPKSEKPAEDKYTEEPIKITATVGTPSEYAWVVDKYNSGNFTDLVINLEKTLDFKGAMCVIQKAKGNITIQSANPGTQVTIKNITSNILLDEKTVHNEAGTNADYYSAGIIAKCDQHSSIMIKDVTFENINVKSPSAGGTGVIVGVLQNANVTLENIAVKDCSVIGHRDVGSLVGAIQNCVGSNKGLTLKGNISLNNVSVKTTGGRSGLVVGKVNGDNSKIIFDTNSPVNLVITNSAMSIYEDAALEQEFADGSTIPSNWTVASKAEVEGADKVIYSFKGLNKDTGNKDYSAYGYKSDALVLVERSGDKWKAITSVDDFKTYWNN